MTLSSVILHARPAGWAGLASLFSWVYLLLFRGRFWRMRVTPQPSNATPPEGVVGVIPARNEAGSIGVAIRSLLAQDYAGDLRIVVVDDASSDGTAAEARHAALAAGASERVTIIDGAPLPPGWTGKLWAVSQGVREALRSEPTYLLLTDADIVHARGNLSELVARAEAGNLDLASVMVLLRNRSFAERILIPAFVFFFFMLYPPAWIRRRQSRSAGAAGGCMLVRCSALERAGGIESIRGEVIDDCALAGRVKSTGGAVWLGLSRQAESLRAYAGFGEIWRMISRTAFAQLRHSGVLLAATVLGLALVYLVPPVLLFAGGRTAALGLVAWLLMSIAFVPALRYYRQPALLAALLPAAATFYLGATIDSAVRYWLGRGGMWKGRAQDRP